MDGLIEEPRRFDRLCAKLTLGAGFQRVKQNRGQAGMDGVSTEDFEARLDEELSPLQRERVSWTDPPSPVRRVEIPKPGGQGGSACSAYRRCGIGGCKPPCNGCCNRCSNPAAHRTVTASALGAATTRRGVRVTRS